MENCHCLHLKTTGRCLIHTMLSSLSIQGMALPAWITIGLQEWPKCAKEAAMPLDLIEKLLQLRVARSQGAVMLSCTKASSLLRRPAGSIFLRASRTWGGAGPSDTALSLANQTSRNRFHWDACCTPAPTPEKGLLTHSHSAPHLGKVHMTRFYISSFKRH